MENVTKTLYELMCKTSDPLIISNLIKEANLPKNILDLIEEEAICRTYHKLPYEVREMDAFDYNVLLSIIKGRQAVEEKQKKELERKR